MYNSPVLFDASSVLTDELIPNAYFTKAAIITDTPQEMRITRLQEALYDTPMQYHVLNTSAELRKFISSQKMGTSFYVLASWENAVEIFDAAVEEGVSEVEIQVKLRDEPKRYVYCMKCFTSSEIARDAKKVQCSCGIHLEIGPFYSKVRQGYIGYPFVPEV